MRLEKKPEPSHSFSQLCSHFGVVKKLTKRQFNCQFLQMGKISYIIHLKIIKMSVDIYVIKPVNQRLSSLITDLIFITMLKMVWIANHAKNALDISNLALIITWILTIIIKRKSSNVLTTC